MAKRIVLSEETLAKLGAAPLAALLMEIAEGDVVLKRRLRMALAGPEQAAADVRKRLATIKRAKSYIEWDKTRALVKDLDTQLQAITEKIAPEAPAEALDLLWQFMSLAGPLYNRCDDSSGYLGDVFYQALQALPALAKAARPAPEALAAQVIAALQDSDYGQYDGVIPLLAEALGPRGLSELKAQVKAIAKEPISVPPKAARKVVGWGSNGETYAHEIEASHRKSMTRRALKDIADAEGDVDGFMAQYDAKTRKAPAIAAEIAIRLLAADRAQEALTALDAATGDVGRWQDWYDTRLDVLEALGRADEAQAQRWQRFEIILSTKDLRGYLKRLPDFDDIEAEERALDYAQGFSLTPMALHFLCHWPALDHAAALVLQLGDTLDGNDYETLTTLADQLSARHPVAATLALRAMITFALKNARSKRYRHAARHLLACESLAVQITDYGAFPDHSDFVRSLRAVHGRKTSFWTMVAP